MRNRRLTKLEIWVKNNQKKFSVIVSFLCIIYAIVFHKVAERAIDIEFPDVEYSSNVERFVSTF